VRVTEESTLGGQFRIYLW